MRQQFHLKENAKLHGKKESQMTTEKEVTKKLFPCYKMCMKNKIRIKTTYIALAILNENIISIE